MHSVYVVCILQGKLKPTASQIKCCWSTSDMSTSCTHSHLAASPHVSKVNLLGKVVSCSHAEWLCLNLGTCAMITCIWVFASVLGCMFTAVDGLLLQVTEGPNAGKLALLDFGLVAEIPPPDRAAMISSVIHLANRDCESRPFLFSRSLKKAYPPWPNSSPLCFLSLHAVTRTQVIAHRPASQDAVSRLDVHLGRRLFIRTRPCPEFAASWCRLPYSI